MTIIPIPVFSKVKTLTAIASVKLCPHRVQRGF